MISDMRAGAKTVLGISLVLVVLVLALSSVYGQPYEPTAPKWGSKWDSKRCKQDTWDARPYAFMVCYDR